ncbi:5'-nucleotidase C-terminal domain-containing protein, partial [Azospirillum brasilense]|uniref:5'-nucleotidase C-terminal domain-containing protein n=1 Tax=Azospirillum brasilense TaxID=192 RepID=UPI002000176E
MPKRGNGGAGRFSGWRAVLAAGAVAALGAVAPAVSAAELSIVFTSTMADIEPVEGEGGLANLATLLGTKRAEGNTLFLHGGASLTAGVLSTFDRGAHMIDLLNELQPDMMAVTKRDLGFGKDELTLRSYEARFPFVSATAIDRNTGKVMEGLEPSALLDTPVGKIGVVSAISPELTVQYIVPDIEVRPPATIAAEARALRAQGANYVVAILDNAPEAVEALRGEPAIDALLQLSATGKDVLEADKGKLFGVHVNVKGSAFVLRLDGDGKAPPALAGADIVPLAGLTPDAAMEKRVGVYLARLSELLDINIGTTATPLDTRRAAVRTGENAFASLIADAMRGHFNTDVAFINGGNIRGNRQYEAGTVRTPRDSPRQPPLRGPTPAVTSPAQTLRRAAAGTAGPGARGRGGRALAAFFGGRGGCAASRGGWCPPPAPSRPSISCCGCCCAPATRCGWRT